MTYVLDINDFPTSVLEQEVPERGRLRLSGPEDLALTTLTSFYFATPYHSWERGTSENTNGLIRQYLPKRQSMARVTQRHCSRIAQTLNNRPRKRLGFRTPKECYENISTI